MKKVFAVLLIFLMCFSFSACLNGNEAGKDSNKEGKIPSVVSYYPQKDDTAFTNPDTGWVFYDNAFDGFEIPENMFSYYAGLIKGKVQTIAVMSTWGYIEKEEGVYDWSLMDKSIDFWESQGFDIHLRFCTDFNFYSVQSAVGCPEYLYTKYEVPYQIRQVEGNNTAKFPDYNHPKYQEKLGLLLDELFERYAGRPAVKMVDLRAFGLWGEWHTGYQYEDLADRQSALKSIIDIWSEKLQSYGKYLMLSSSYDPDYTGSANVTEFMQKSAFDYAMTKDNVAIRRDGIGGAVHYGYNGWFDGTFCDLYTQSGKRMPLVIEMMPGRVDPYYNFERMLEEALSMKGTLCCVYGADKGGINSFIGNPDLVNKGNRELGYRFEVDEAQYYDFVPAGATQSLRLSIKNSAVGRAYKDYPMKIEILNRQDDTIAESILTDFYASEVIKGESFFYETQFPLPKNLPEGKYRIVVSVCDPVSSKNLRLGIVDGDQELRYPIGEFRVDNEYKSPESFFVEPMTNGCCCDKRNDNRWGEKRRLAI